MCGIVGIANSENQESFVAKALKKLENRGKDASHSKSINKVTLGHNLHAIVNHIPQPLESENALFVANCEIYNWKELAKQYDLDCKNDAELLFKLLEKKGIKETLELLDGVYAFAYCNKQDNTITLARDIIGVKPLWYAHYEGFSFASEKKVLENATELNPRKILRYNVQSNSVELEERPFFVMNSDEELTEDKEAIQEKTRELITNAITKRVPKQKVGLLFSGGIDSTLIAKILKDNNVDLTCYTAAFEEVGFGKANDLEHAEKVAKELGLTLKTKTIGMKEVETYLKKIVPLIETSNVVKVGVALTFYVACELAKEDNIKVMFSGLGSEELFAGYDRHKKSLTHGLDVNHECRSGLLKMYERDLYRDDVITMEHGIELRLPFLDKELTKYALRIPPKYKINENQTKIIVRDISKYLKIAEDTSERPKQAAQYGSKFDRAIQKLAKKNNQSKSEYLGTFYPKSNLKLAALWSTGKDSTYATYVMQKQNYNITCLITLKSSNLSSYMFHTPNISLAKLHAESMGLPLIEQETTGEKEKELTDLKSAIQKAKEEFHIDGVITGALYSHYQRERIEKVCDELGLKIFSPLWHINQETEVREIINKGFTIAISAVAAEGLGKKWLGKTITPKDVDELVALNQTLGLNVAGEGGEYESLVLDGPLFKKKIVVEESEIVMENDITGNWIVKKAKLEEK